MRNPDCIPRDYTLIKPAESLADLARPFGRDTSCRLHLRDLALDFNPLARALEHLIETRSSGIDMGRADLEKTALRLSGAARTAAGFILEHDMPELEKNFRAVHLRVIKNYQEIERSAHAFHADLTSRALCAYNGPVTEWLRLDQVASRRGSECGARADADIRAFPVGAAWHGAGIAGNWPAPPFIHRAPRHTAGEPPRLLATAALRRSM